MEGMDAGQKDRTDRPIQSDVGRLKRRMGLYINIKTRTTLAGFPTPAELGRGTQQ